MRVFVTGASAGIGAALARHYAARGAVVGAIARRAATLDALAARSGGCIVPLVADVRDAAAMDAAARQFIAAHGLPDVVIANAGVSAGTATGESADNAVFRELFETNVHGLLHTFQPFLAALRTRGHGTLAGIASVAGIRGLPGAGAYSASKAAAIAYLEALRIEERTHGLRVVTVCPGYIDTDMTRRNPYRMPFLLPAGEAARRIARVIDAGRSSAIVPWQMALAARVLRVLPDAVFDALAARSGRKPRREP